MSRTIKEIQLDQPIDVVSMVMDDFIYHNHFMRTDWEGEMVFSAEDSHGGTKYFKWSYAGGMFRAESWVKGPMGGEDSLSGVFQGATKRAFSRELDALYLRLKTESGSNMSGGHIGSDPLHHEDEVHSNHQNWTQDTLWQQDADRYPEQVPQQGRNTSYTVTDQYETGAPRTRNRSSGGNPVPLQLCIYGIIAGMFIPVAGLILAVIAKARAKGTDSEHTVNVLVTIIFFIVGVRFLIAFLVPFLGMMINGLS